MNLFVISVLSIRYPCTECDYIGKTSRSLKRHVDMKHLGIRFKCEECDQISTRTEYLKTHVENVHRGVRHQYTNY